jgi:dienelactone hydrolase
VSSLTKPSLTNRFTHRAARGLIALTVASSALTGSLALAPAARAAGYERGPDPTVASISAAQGPFAVTQMAARNVSGFGSGTIYYPTDRSQGSFGVVAIVPGFVSLWAQMSWLGPRLASQGFVVIGIDTQGLGDWPSVRGDELKAALDNVVADSRLAGIVDPTRRAVAGWSMGGGGALDLASSGAGLKAAIAIAPWEVVDRFSADRVPSLVITGQNDTIATNGASYYNSVAGEKAYLEIKNGDHFFTATANATQAAEMIAWLKRWVDQDSRYTQFLCPGPAVSTNVSNSRTTCPF